MTDDKSRKALLIALIGIAVAAAIVAVVMYAGGGSSQQSSSAEKIKIEVRANPTAEITVNGKHIGKTPISLQFPKSNKEVVIEATLVRHFVKRDAKKDEIFQGTRKLTLDRDHLVDFNYGNTTLVETNEDKAERPN
jgi:flagellar basal body-associated protein FliL